MMRAIVTIIMFILTATHTRTLSARDMRELTMRDGLTDLTINKIYKDSQGYVYFCTDISVDRFDGVRIRRFPIPGSNELARRVRTIATGPDGSLYAGNGDGLWRFIEDRFERMAGNVVQTMVNDLLTEGDSMFIATNNGLYIMSSGRFRHIVPGAASVVSNTNHIRGLCMSADKRTLWATTIGGLLSIDLPSCHVTKILDTGHPGRMFQYIVKCGDYLYVTAMGEGILRFDPTTATFQSYHDWGNYDVLALSSADDRYIYVGVNGEGVYFIDTATGQETASYMFSTGDDGDLRSNSVYSLLVEDSGQIWVGYYQAGVDYTVKSRSLFDIYVIPGVIDTSNLTVRSFYIEDSLKLIGTRKGLYVVDEKLGRCTIFTKPRIASGMIFTIMKYNGEYFIGTGGGLYVYNHARGSIRPFQAECQQLKHTIMSFATDALNRLWVGTVQGLVCIDGGKVEHIFTDDNSQLPHRSVYEVFFDSAGTGWICTEQGVAIFDGKNVRSTGFKIAGGHFNHEKIRSVYEDSHHNLFFIPDRGIPVRTNLQLTDYEYVKSAGVTGPLPSSINPTFVLEDADSLLWIGSSDGLICTDLHDRYIHFTRFDGLPSLSFTLSKPMRDDDGNLWFGNTRGLAMLNRAKSKSAIQGLNPVKITEVRSNGEIVVNGGKPIDSVELSDGSRSLQVMFSDFSFTSPEYQSFEYRLSPKMGADEWARVQGVSEVHLYNLENGNHTLHIRHLGDPSSETALPIRVSGYGHLLPTLTAILFIVVLTLGAWLAVCHQRMAALGTKVAVKHNDGKYKTATVNSDNCKRLHRKLEKLMAERQLYLDPHLKVSQLADELGVTTMTMSYLFNKHLDTNYYDYINAFRVKHFCKMVTEGSDSRYTLTAMSEKCGFGSRASFFRSFYKVMGLSPGEYIRRRNTPQ